MRWVRAAALLLALAAPVQAAQTLKGRWWIVPAASSAPDSTMQDVTKANRAGDAARRCGLQPMEDFPAKSEGFTPDHYVSIVGGFTIRPKAEAALARLCPCVPDAYLRHGSYAGE